MGNLGLKKSLRGREPEAEGEEDEAAGAMEMVERGQEEGGRRG